MALLATLWRFRSLIALAGMAAAGALLWLQTERLGVSQLKSAQWQANYGAMVDANVGNLKAIADLKSENRRIARIADAARGRNTALAAEIEDLQQRIADDPNPIPADLCHMLDELRRIAGAAGPACGDQDGG